MSLFPKYFQEVYDADMHEITSTPYDDSPAGFRLLYKYGRSNSAQWTRIQDQKEFVEALASFFVAAEMEISSSDIMEGLQHDVSEITTAIVMQIRTPEFLESAFYRMAVAHHTAPSKILWKIWIKLTKNPGHTPQGEPWIHLSAVTGDANKNLPKLEDG